MFPSLDILASEFELVIYGNKERTVGNIGSLRNRNSESLNWSKRLDFLENIEDGVVVCSKSDFQKIKPNPCVVYLTTDKSPRLIFAKILTKYMLDNQDDDFVNVVEQHRSNPTLRIGDNVFIGRNVTIGKGTLIHHNVVIHSNTHIGENCILKANSSIGTEGLGLEMDPETGRYFKFPQIGGVRIEDEVEIGPGSTIRRSALDDTIIGKGTKIGALCNVGHNCIIGENCILTCNVITSGSSQIGNNVFLGVGSTVKQGINVGNNVTLGQGAVVVKHVPDGETWVGNPAMKIEKK